MSTPLFFKIKSNKEIDNFKQDLLLQTGQYAEDIGIRTQADLNRAIETCQVVYQGENCFVLF